MAKKVTGYINLQVPAGAANPSPPIGPALGQRGVNIMEFCKAFNAATQELEKGMRLCGVTKLSELTPAHVNAIDLERHGGAWTPIPPSPYAFTAPAVGVRSPPFPKGAKSREELESEIASLQRQLSKASGKRGWSFGVAAVGDDSHAAYLPSLARVMLTSVLRSTFSRTTGGMLHRSALFMIVFLMVQAMLNLTVPLGAATNNKAARALTDNLTGAASSGTCCWPRSSTSARRGTSRSTGASTLPRRPSRTASWLSRVPSCRRLSACISRRARWAPCCLRLLGFAFPAVTTQASVMVTGGTCTPRRKTCSRTQSK